MSDGRRRLLVLAPFVPRLDAAHGGGRVVARLLLAHARSSRVALLALRPPGDGDVDDAVRAACEVVELVPNAPVGRSAAVAWRERRRLLELLTGSPPWVASVTSAAYRRALVRLCRDFEPEVVLAELGVMASYLAVVPAAARRVLVEHDPGVRRTAGPLERAAWRRHARRAAGSADAVVVFTDEDAERLRPFAAPASILVRIPPPWPPPPEARDPLGTMPPTVLFVGNFRHAPNVEAALRLVRLLPELRRGHPEVELALVGEGLSGSFGAGVVAPGRVDDVGPWLDRAAVVAAPLSSGGGVRVKVVEALAAGKAVVGTPLAFEGLDVEPAREAVVAESDEELVAAVSSLLDDASRRRELGAAARAWALRRPTEEDVGRAYSDLFDRLGET